MAISIPGLMVSLALTGLNMALQMSRKIEGPRLDDLKVTTGDYGAALPMFWGTRKFQGCPIFYAENIREEKHKNKTKGGKYNEYKYFGTWACAIAGHPIEGVTRIWFDKHLAYDATGAGPRVPGGFFSPSKEDFLQQFEDATFSSVIGLLVRSKGGGGMRIYYGSELQEPDPRMLATIEAQHGAGSCPSYRGTSYIFFDDIPLEKVGNRIPQITIETVSNRTEVYPSSSTPVPFGLSRFTFSPDFSRFMWAIGLDFVIIDTATRTVITTGTLPSDLGGANISFGIDSFGHIYGVDGSWGGGVVKKFTADGVFYMGEVFSFTQVVSSIRLLMDGRGLEHIFTIGYGPVQTFSHYMLGPNIEPEVLVPLDEVGVAFKVDCFVVDGYGDIIGIGCDSATEEIYFWRLVATGENHTLTKFYTVTTSGIAGSSGVIGAAYYNGHFIVHINDTLWKVNADDFTLTTSALAPSVALDGLDTAWINLPPNSSSIWMHRVEVSLNDLSTIRTIEPSYYPGGYVLGPLIYDPVNHALLQSPTYGDDLRWLYLDRIGSDGVQLSSIANDVADWCGVEDYEFGSLSQMVPGYSATLGTGRDILEPLFDAYDCDVRVHDFSVEGVTRGGASNGTIATEWMVRSGNEPRYKVDIKQASELPRALVFNFSDLDKEQQANSVRVSRPADTTDAKAEQSIDMSTLAVSADTARSLAERYFRRMWNGREVTKLSLTHKELRLEPADRKVLELDGEERFSRCVKTTIQKDAITTEWVSDSPSLALLTNATGAVMDGRLPSVIPVPLPTKGVVLDVPLAADVHDNPTPFVYYAAGPYAAGMWTGCDFLSSETGIDFVSGWASVTATDGMSWGYCVAALGDALPWVEDTGNELHVMMKSGTLTSVTHDEMLNNAALNLLLVGDEYVQFQTATLQGDGSYKLTGLLRGGRGTEQHIGTHATGEAVIVFDARVGARAMGVSEIGDTDYYKAVTVGRDPDAAFTTSLTYSAAPHRPYAPVHGVLTRNTGTNDWSITATRRTRLGGANIDGQDVPLGESSEAWEADIMDGATVKRTITGTSLPLVYTSAAQVSDWGSNQTTLSVSLYQKSPSLGLRGFPLALAA